MDYLNELNDIQRKAVVHGPGPVLIVAGPGSGKTRVLTYRIAHLINSGVAPYKILTLTFTNKAAKEMKTRISSVVGGSANQVWAGTFHSIFSRILRIEADKIGYTSNFTIYDRQDSESLITRIVKELNLDPKVYNARAIISRISSAKSNIIPPKSYEQNEELRQQDKAAKKPFIYKIYALYAARCKKSDAMDFDDLLYQLFVLLYKNPDEVLEKYRKKFEYVLVDEFQDTNYLQYAIVKKLIHYPGSPNNINVVGDDAQSIYAFRGATIQNILDFEKDFKELVTYKLEQNYRSSHHIVQAANDIINNNKGQIKKKIWTAIEPIDSLPIKVLQTMTDGEEARRVADHILEQKNRDHLKNSDVAILYRTNAQSRILEEFLRRYNISYKIFGGLSFYQRKEIKDIIAYLRLIVNPNDEEALQRVINYPKRGVGASSVQKVANHARLNNMSMWEALFYTKLPNKAATGIGGFVKMIDGLRKQTDKLNAFEITQKLLEKSGIAKTLKADNSEEGLNRVDNLQAFADGILEFVDSDELIDDAILPDKSLASYLSSVALHTDNDKIGEGEDDYVTLMSVHASKGLEFKSVFVTGMEESLFPSLRSESSPEAIDEERRLFYVAVTRAERFLTLSYANTRIRYGDIKQCRPSRFLYEIGDEHLNLDNPINDPSPAKKSGSQRSGVSGISKRQMPQPTVHVDASDFKPSPSSSLRTGMKVLHLRFGNGRITDIAGNGDKKVATIIFDALGEKRIVLKFAKLQIMEG